jgi:uncharacterized protein YndB with AHSA1/START domain
MTELPQWITVEAIIQQPPDEVWELWTSLDHIVQWNYANEDWCCPHAVNDARSGGQISWRMESRDGAMGFDINGIYEEVRPHELLIYRMEDGREVRIFFQNLENETKITEMFEPEELNPLEMQQQGWQAILNNFKKYAEQSHQD